MLQLFKHLKKREWLMICVSLVFIVTQVWLDLKLPDYMSTITTLVETEGSEMSEILKYGGYMLLCAVGSMIAAMITGYFAARVAAGLAMTLREKVFKSVMGFNHEEIGKFSTASLITHTTNDITQVQMLIAMGLQAIIKAPILMVWTIVKIAGKQWQWSLATASAVGIIMIVLLITIVLAMPRFKIIQTLTDNLNRVTRENITGIRVVRAYNAEAYQTQKFERENEHLTDTNLFTNRVMALLTPTMSLVSSGISLAVYWIGAYLIDAAVITERLSIFSDMVVFSSYAMQVIMSFTMLTMMFIMLPRVMVSANRINEVIGTEVHMKNGSYTDENQQTRQIRQNQQNRQIQQYQQVQQNQQNRRVNAIENISANESAVKNRNEKTITPSKGKIEFKNVCFTYPGGKSNVLSDISFTANPGETVAIIGATGSGKSTLVNLIPRFYDIKSGEILVDGIPVQDYDLHALRDKIGYVAQKAVLFSRTVASNVMYSDSVPAAGTICDENTLIPETEQKILDALDTAQAIDFVGKMPNGIYSPIAQSGTNVSGGQRQRLSIARAVYKQPEIYIFDDSFSALDYKTDRALKDALNRKTAEATKIIIAQRIGTVRTADKILVLEDGKIVGMGTHKELMNTCQTYQSIAYSQLSKEELADA